MALIKQQAEKTSGTGGAAAGNPAGSNTHIQYNDNGSFGNISTFTFDGTDLKIADDVKLIFGTKNLFFA